MNFYFNACVPMGACFCFEFFDLLCGFAVTVNARILWGVVDTKT
jgi:hypothetical protein